METWELSLSTLQEVYCKCRLYIENKTILKLFLVTCCLISFNMCVYVCIYIYIIYICICVYVCVYLCVYVYAYVYVYMYMCMCVCACIYICVCMYIYIYIYIYTHMCVCVYVYVYIYIYIAYMCMYYLNHFSYNFFNKILLLGSWGKLACLLQHSYF